MILNGIKYLFYSTYKIALINYGKEGGAIASYIIVSILLSVNVVAIVGFLNKLIFSNPDISFIIFLSIFIISLFINYLLIMNKSKYKNIISSFEEEKKKIRFGTLKILTYIFISFVLFATIVLMKVA